MDLVLLCTVPDNFQAEMIVAAMKENNIPVHKRDLGNAGMLNLLRGNSSEGEEIYVPRQDFAKHRKFYREWGFSLHLFPCTML